MPLPDLRFGRVQMAATQCPTEVSKIRFLLFQTGLLPLLAAQDDDHNGHATGNRCGDHQDHAQRDRR